MLGANLTAGTFAVDERLKLTAAIIAGKGMDALAMQASTFLLDGALIRQSTVIAFDTAFNAIALLFVIAAPVLISLKVALSRYSREGKATRGHTI